MVVEVFEDEECTGDEREKISDMPSSTLRRAISAR